MNISRPAKPLALHRLDGTLRHDRHGRTKAFAGGEPAKPEWLVGDAAELWQTIVERYPPGGLCDVDAAALTMLCHSFDRWQHYAAQLTASDTNEYKTAILASMFAKQFTALAARFGLTPSDRAKLNIGTEQPDADELKFFGT